MKTWQLVAIRVYMLTLGRSAAFARLLRRALVLLLISRKKRKAYHASSRFFSQDELGGTPKGSGDEPR